MGKSTINKQLGTTMSFHGLFRWLRLFLGTALLVFSGLSVFHLAGCTDREDADKRGTDGDTTVAETFKGRTYIYDMTIAMDQDIEAQGTPMTGTMQGTGTMTMTEGNQTHRGRRWQAATSISMAGEMMGTPIDTVKQEQSMIYTVSPDGKLIDMELSGVDEGLAKELTRMLENTSGRQSAMQMFMQKSWLGKEIGESWEEETLDTINADDIAFGQGMMKGSVYLITRTRTRYTYHGTVDTLGVKAARLRYELLDLTLTGEMKGKEIEISISSNATGAGIYYYAVDDGLQLAGSSDLTTSSVIAMPSMNQTMPMKQHAVTTVVRRR